LGWLPVPRAPPRWPATHDDRGSSPTTSGCCASSCARALAEVWPALEIVAEAKNGAEAVALTRASTGRHRLPRHPHARHAGIEAARAIAQLPFDDDDAETVGERRRTALARARDRLHHGVRPVRDRGLRAGRRRLRPEAAERERLQVTVERVRSASPIAAPAKRPTRAGMQQLLQKLTAKINPAPIRG
jgi:hypothetical protein